MWIYEKSPDNTARFALGTIGEKPLICIGVNPSTAEPNKLDATLKTVQRTCADTCNFDSYIMLNVYAQRACNPNDLHANFLQALKAQNEYHIAKLIAGKPYTIWAAWGGLIDKRPYLTTLLYDIINLSELANCTWVQRGRTTVKGHPHHPLYVKNGTPFEMFDIVSYMNVLMY